MPRKRFSSSLASSVCLAVLVLLSILFRGLKLGSIPGFNGDEAWPMVQAHEFLSAKGLLTRTPSSRILTPTYLLMNAAVLSLTSPSVAMARLSALICGLLLILAAYFLTRRMFGKQAGLGAFVLVCCSPPLIAFSRIGWEPSQIPLASLLAFYFCWTGNSLLLGVTLLLAVLIHPTCVFLAPAFFLPKFAAFVQRSKIAPKIKAFLLSVDLWAACGLFIFFVAQKNAHRIGLSGRPDDGTWLTTVVRSSWNLGQLFSGVSVYEDFIAPVPRAVGGLFGAASLLVLSLSVAGLVRRAKKEPPLKWLARGCACSLFAFLVIGGPIGFVPGFERWSLFLVVPGILLASLGLAELLIRDEGAGAFRWACLGLGGLLLAGFAHFYFEAELKDGALAHPTYATGPLEPKTAAFAQILNDSREKAPGSVLIIADEWWNYWPMRYFALPHPEITVALVKGDSNRLEGAYAQGAFLVGFPSGSIANEFSKAASDSWAFHYDYRSYAGKSILQLWVKR